MTRVELISSLLGDKDEEDPDIHPIDRWREGLIGFILDHWITIEPQITCPAKDIKGTNPKPCFGCLDQQVVACVVSNQGRNEQLIRRKLR